MITKYLRKSSNIQETKTKILNKEFQKPNSVKEQKKNLKNRESSFFF